MRKERVEVIQEVAMSVGNASGTEYQDPLLVLFGDTVAGGGFGGGRFREGLVDSGHCKFWLLCELMWTSCAFNFNFRPLRQGQYRREINSLLHKMGY